MTVTLAPILVGAWSPEVQLNLDAAGSDQTAPSIVRAPFGILYVAYQGNQRLANNDLYLVCSSNGGTTWSTPFVLAATDVHERFPEIGANYEPTSDRIRVHVAYKEGGGGGVSADGDVALVRHFAPRATPCALALESPRVVLTSTLGEDFEAGELVADRVGNLFLVWRDQPLADFRIRFAVVESNGSSLIRSQVLSNSVNSLHPYVAVRGTSLSSDVVLAAWEEQDSDTGNNVILQRSTDGGFGWTRTTDDRGSTDVGDPAVALDPAGVAAYLVVDSGAAATAGIEVRHGSFPNGVFLADATAAVCATRPCAEPDVRALSAPVAVVAWHAGATGQQNAFASSTANAGLTWSAQAVIHPSSSTNAQKSPRVAVGSAFAVFTNDKDTAGEIEVFFSRDVGVTGLRLEGLEAAYAGAQVCLDWWLIDPRRVSGFRPIRRDTAGVESALAELPIALDERYATCDATPGDDPDYFVDVLLDDGSLERHGPVRPAGGAEEGGCACRFLPRERSDVLASILGALALALVASIARASLWLSERR